MKKIAFLSYYSDSVNRGVETYVSQLALELSRLGYSTRIYNSHDLKSVSDLPVFNPVPDIVIPANGRLQALRARLWAVAHGKKCLISGQSGPGADDKFNLLTFPDAFVGLTAHQCRWARSFNPLVKIARIPNGVDLSHFTSRLPPLALSIRPPTVLYVAALEPIKRHKLLIEAVSLTPYSLLLAGSGSLADEIVSYCEHHIPGRFEILSLPYSRMPRLYNSAHIFAYPTSAWESFGIAMLEAMASGLPVVATDDPIRREIVGPAGFFADPEDPAEFAQKLVAASKKHWGDLPQKQAQNYSWSKIAGLYHHLFSRL